MRLEDLFWVGPVAAVLAGGAVFALLRRLARAQKGHEAARTLSAAIRQGLLRYWKIQGLLCGGALVLGLAVLAALLSAGVLSDALLPLAFLSGGVCCALAAFAASFVCAAAAPRAAAGCARRMEKGFRTAFSAGSAAALAAAGLALGHASLWFVLVRFRLDADPAAIARAVLFFGLGGTLTALLLRGGNVFAKSAAGAALGVRQTVELPRDPSCVAVQVGYAVGPAAALAAEIFDSFSLILLCAMALGGVAGQADQLSARAALLPLLAAAAGLLCSLIGPAGLRPRERDDRATLPRMSRLNVCLTALLTAAVCLPIAYALTGRWTYYYPILTGLLAGCGLVLYADLTAGDRPAAIRDLAETADRGPSYTLLGGLSLGMIRAIPPLLLFAALPAAAALALPHEQGQELYTLSLVGVGMLSIAAPVLAGALCGPITDCAKNTSALTARSADDVDRCRDLAAVGQCAARGGRSFCAVAGALASALLLALCAFPLSPELIRSPGPSAPGLLLGGVLAAVFVLALMALLLTALRRAAAVTAREVLRQSRDIQGLAEGEVQPDYDKCTTLCAVSSLVRMLPPALLAVAAPALVWLLPDGALTGFCAAALLFFLPISLFFTHTSAVLDSARRYLETGRHGGSGSLWHRGAAMACHLIGPWADAVAPALPTAVKLCLTVALLLRSLPAGT